MTKKASIEERFFEKVRKTNSCWIWTAALDKDGYGHFQYPGNKKVRAHRFSWELHNGSIPEGVPVLHNCPTGDNPSCVNPAHLWLGTPKDNSEDMVKKGRQAKGEKNGNAKFNAQMVLVLRQMHAAGCTVRGIARFLGLDRSVIRQIVSNKTWRSK